MKHLCRALRDRKSREASWLTDLDWAAWVLSRFANAESIISPELKRCLKHSSRLTTKQGLEIYEYLNGLDRPDSSKEIGSNTKEKCTPRELAVIELVAEFEFNVRPLFTCDTERQTSQRHILSERLEALRTMSDSNVVEGSCCRIRLEAARFSLHLQDEQPIPHVCVVEMVNRTINTAPDIVQALKLVWLIVRWAKSNKRFDAYCERQARLALALKILVWSVDQIESCSHCLNQVQLLSAELEEQLEELLLLGHSEFIGTASALIADALQRTGTAERHFRRKVIEHHCISAEMFSRSLDTSKSVQHFDRLQDYARNHNLTRNDKVLELAILRIGASIFARCGRPLEALKNLHALLARNCGSLATFPPSEIAELATLTAELGELEIANRFGEFIAEAIGDPPFDCNFEGNYVYGSEYPSMVANHCNLSIALGNLHELVGTYWNAMACYETAHHNAKLNFITSALSSWSIYATILLNRANCASHLGDHRRVYAYSVGILTALREGDAPKNIRPDQVDILLQAISLHTESCIAWGNVEQASNLIESAEHYRTAFSKQGRELATMSLLRLLRAKAILAAETRKLSSAFDEINETFQTMREDKQICSGLVGVFVYDSCRTLLDIKVADAILTHELQPSARLELEALVQEYDCLIKELASQLRSGKYNFGVQYYSAQVSLLKCLLLSGCVNQATALINEVIRQEESLTEAGKGREFELYQMDRLVASGRLAAERGDTAAARRSFRSAFDIASSREWDFPATVVLTTFLCMADSEYDQWVNHPSTENPDLALHGYGRYLKHLNSVRVQEVDPRMRAARQLKAKHVFCRLHNMAMTIQSSSKMTCREVFEISEMARSRLILDNLTILPPPKLENVPEELFLRLNSSRTEIINQAAMESSASAEREFEASPVNLPIGTDGNSNRRFVRNRYYDLLREVQRADPNYDALDPISPVDLEAAVKMLPDERSLIIQFFIGENGTLALLISNGECDVVKLKSCSRDALQNILNQWRNSYTAFRNSIGDEDADTRWSQQVDDCLLQVAKLAILPLISRLSGFDQIILVPHMQLHVFPLQAAPCGEGARFCDLFNVTTMPSVSIGSRVLDRSRYNGTHATVLSPGEMSTPFSFIESLAVADLLHCQNVDTTETSLYEMSTNAVDSKFWHFIGHGNLDSSNPLASVLCSDVTADSHWSQLSDVYSGLSLPNTDVVTLSACETAMAIPNRLDEFVSFPSAFLYAGAKSVVGSHWIVKSLPTTLLMQRFYMNILEGNSVSVSLRMAQNWLRGREDSRGEAIRSGEDLKQYFETAFRKLASDSDEMEYWGSCIAKEASSSLPPFRHTAHWAAFSCHGLGWIRPEGEGRLKIRSRV